jgi:hypothetical protein
VGDGFTEHQTHDAAARESKRLEHPDLARALAHTHHQGVANDHQDRHERRPTTRTTINAMLPNWATNALLKAFSVSVAVS